MAVQRLAGVMGVRSLSFLRQLPRKLLVEDLGHGEGDDDLARGPEDGVDLAEGVVGVGEGHEEALVAAGRARAVGLFLGFAAMLRAITRRGRGFVKCGARKTTSSKVWTVSSKVWTRWSKVWTGQEGRGARSQARVGVVPVAAAPWAACPPACVRVHQTRHAPSIESPLQGS